VESRLYFFVIKAAETILWTAIVKPAVQVTVPVNLKGNDSSLETDTVSLETSVVIAACAKLLLSQQRLEGCHWQGHISTDTLTLKQHLPPKQPSTEVT